MRSGVVNCAVESLFTTGLNGNQSRLLPRRCFWEIQFFVNYTINASRSQSQWPSSRKPEPTNERNLRKTRGACRRGLPQGLLPEVLVAVSTSRLSCKRAGKARTLGSIWRIAGYIVTDGLKHDRAPQLAKKFDMLPWLAFAISLFSLGFTIFQGIETRRHNRLGVEPYIIVNRFGATINPKFGIQLKNNGLGPAILTEREIVVKGQRIKNEEALRDALKAISEGRGTMTYTRVSIVRPAYEGNMIEASEYKREDQELIWGALTNDVDIRITYCSIYQECKKACLHEDDAEKCAKLSFPK